MWIYSAGSQKSAKSNIVQANVSASSVAYEITLRAESMVVLES
jgi:hypothetical protein